MKYKTISTEYCVEYIEENTPWAVAEFSTEQEAFERLEQCKIAAPLREWQVSRITRTYQRVIKTPEGRTIEV